MSDKPPYKRREVVRLRSGGLEMVVADISPDPQFLGWRVKVVWMDNKGRIREMNIPAFLLDFVSGAPSA